MLARKHRFWQARFSCYTLNRSQITPDLM